LGLMAWFAKDRPARPALSAKVRGAVRWALVGMLVVGAMGAITALGDTLFKVDSLAAGIQQDLNPDAHPFVKMRVLHPVLAVVFAALLAWMGAKVAGDENAGPTLEGLGRGLLMMTFLQTSVGVMNLMMLAPVWLQLTHLLCADLLWLVLVLLSVELWGWGRSTSVPGTQSAPAQTSTMPQAV
jgi:heme A synthase